ncbi:MAG: DUF4230 domain-containing protein [Clostridia bacterium]|nr:DUF4230 domain-containing protein [Clostridia bacterium]
MKRIGKWLLRLLSAGIILAIMVAALPYAGKLLGFLLPTPDPVYATTLLKREMAKVGKLTCLEYQDTGIAAASTSALFLGDVQRVSVPYEYTIALGVDLEKVQISIEDNGVCLTLPPVMMLYDSFNVTGEAEIEDFWLPLSQSRYQKILDNQAAASRLEILSDQELMARAEEATIDKVTALYRQLLAAENLAAPQVKVIYDQGE